MKNIWCPNCQTWLTMNDLINQNTELECSKCGNRIPIQREVADYLNSQSWESQLEMQDDN